MDAFADIHPGVFGDLNASEASFFFPDPDFAGVFGFARAMSTKQQVRLVSVKAERPNHCLFT